MNIWISHTEDVYYTSLLRSAVRGSDLKPCRRKGRERSGDGSASELALISCSPRTNLRVQYRQMSYRNQCGRCSTHSTADFKCIINQMEINGSDLVLGELNQSRGCYPLTLFSVIAQASPMRIWATTFPPVPFLDER